MNENKFLFLCDHRIIILFYYELHFFILRFRLSTLLGLTAVPRFWDKVYFVSKTKQHISPSPAININTTAAAAAAAVEGL